MQDRNDRGRKPKEMRKRYFQMAWPNNRYDRFLDAESPDCEHEINSAQKRIQCQLLL